MAGLGTLINVAAIVSGTLVGLVVGHRLPERARITMLQGVGLAVIALGVRQATGTHNLIFPLVAVVVGGFVGELAGIEARLAGVGDWIRRRVERPVDPEVEGVVEGPMKGPVDGPMEDPVDDPVKQPVGEGTAEPVGGDAAAGELAGGERHRFVEGFVAASLLYVVGPLAILGSIADGLSGDIELLVVKSALDGLVSIIFAATLGWGVGFSVVPVALYQGAITLLAGGADAVLTERMIVELTATGGLLVIGIGLRLLDVKQIRVASFLPALAIAPALVALFAR